MNSSGTAGRVHAANAAAWNQTAEWYRARREEMVPRLAAGESTLHPVEQRMLRGLTPLQEWCQRAVHLQCAAGFDTHSLLNHGAKEVVGVDIAEDLIALATGLSGRLDVRDRASFRCADVLELPPDLMSSADLVYTGKGAIHWMFDLAAWSRSVSALLRPGGLFVLFDFHAMMWMFSSNAEAIVASGVSYFAPTLSYTEWADGHIGELSLADDQLELKQLKPWPPSAVIQGLLDNGLELLAFGEYPDAISSDWTAYPHWGERDRRCVATTYSVIARKPTADPGHQEPRMHT